MSDSARPIVSLSEFIQSTRNTGYKSTASAVAELVDNSIQADARRIQIAIHEEKYGNQREITLALLDDGYGMDPQTMQAALQFGGSGRYNDRNGLGRFGMGLPNSSISQCRKVELFSWLNEQGVYHTYLDIDEVVRQKMTQIPKPCLRSLPAWAKETAGSSGTLVVWKNCDRLDYRKATTIAKKISASFGSIFRCFLLEGVRISVNDELVKPFDPLYLHSDAILRGAQEYCPPLEYRVRVPENENDKATICVRFSILPVKAWHGWSIAEKRRLGITGGAGVSVVRAGREIAYGWYFMGNKPRQNYDDWWRCEINFDPKLDEWFGVTHSKQSVNPAQELISFLSPDIERVAYELNAQVRSEFFQVRETTQAKSIRNAQQRDWMLPQIPKGLERDEGQSIILAKKRTGLCYEIKTRPTADPEFFRWHIGDRRLSILINEDHPFYRNVYSPMVERNDQQELFHLECLLIAFARSEAQLNTEIVMGARQSVLEAWSHILAALLS